MKTTRLVLAAFLLAGSSLVLTTPSFAVDPPGPPGGHPWGPPGGHPSGHPWGSPGGHPGFHFSHHDFAHFSPAEHQAWIGGHGGHMWHNGVYGWWWFAGGIWYFYDTPFDEYPPYVSSEYYVEQPEYGPEPTWWYCNNPPGYYPYVQSCSTPWQPVPVTPPPPPPGPGYGPPPGPAPKRTAERSGPAGQSRSRQWTWPR